MIKGVIFDLDGVIVHTDMFHYKAWKNLAESLSLRFDMELNHKLRGVSRKESFEIILKANEMKMSQPNKMQLLDKKNKVYVDLLSQMSPADLDDGVIHTLKTLKERGIKIAIGSSSKNAKLILGKLGLGSYFNGVSDGTNISQSKPDPEVFLMAAEMIGLKPKDCLVVEDALAGVEAGFRGGFKTAGIGDGINHEKVDFKLETLSDILQYTKNKIK